MSANLNEAIGGVERARRTIQERPGTQNSSRHHPSVRRAVGEVAWSRLPEAVRRRFADDVTSAEYIGNFDTVHASVGGKILAFLCRAIGTPVAPYTGRNISATVRVFANKDGGMVWERVYRFPQRTCIVSSTKQLDETGGFVEALPLGLRMPLDVFERDGILHFLSREYAFRWAGIRIPLPQWLPPGVTHIQHIDEGGGWFRFTMTVTHRWFGEMYFQTGRFRAAGEIV